MDLRRVARILSNVLTLSPTARRYPDVAFLRLWNRIPPDRRGGRLARRYARFLHRRACAQQPRRPIDTVFQTLFLRNLPQFEVLRRLVDAEPQGGVVDFVSIGCSSGAELYSTKWIIHSARPDLRVVATGVDMDAAALLKAQRAGYGREDRELAELTREEIENLCDASPLPLFVRCGDQLRVPDALREDVSWLFADARDPSLPDLLGPRRFVLVNNILCHMHAPEAEACLRNVIRVVAPGGYLLTYGVNLDVRSRVVRRAGLVPVRDDIEAVYLADRFALAKWPLTYWGCEPFDSHRRDWPFRYGSVFQRPHASPTPLAQSSP